MESRKKVFRIVGMVLIVVALGAIGYSAYNLISADVQTQQSLDQLIKEIEENGSFVPEDSLAPEASLAPDGGADSILSPDATPGPEDGDTGDGTTGGTDNTGGKPSAKPQATAGTKSSGLGILVFDSLGGRKVPVLEGATEGQLARGAAHHSHSSKPGSVGNCVIYGHRNTVFRSFGKLKDGDTIRLELPGKTYTYKISSMAIVDPDDSRIFQAYGKAVMTLVTCYPFDYVGSAPQRYIVVAVLQ